MEEHWAKLLKKLPKIMSLFWLYFSKQDGISSGQRQAQNLLKLCTTTHQGFVTDTTMTYSIPDFKISDIKERISKLSRFSSLRELAHVVGKISSVESAVGPVVRVMLRSSHQILAQAEEEYGEEAWDNTVEITDDVFRDLGFLKTNVAEYNGQPIINSQTGVCLNAVVDTKLVRPLLETEELSGIWSGDASDIQAVGYDVLDPLTVHIEYFTYSQTEMSSGARELVVIESTLENCVKPNQSDSHKLIYWLTDSKCLVAWLERGSKIKSISDRIVVLFRKLHQMKLRLVPIWIPRSDYIITLADAVSKFKDTDDWGLSEKSFKILQDLSPTKFTLDTFANCTNKKCPKFYSKVPSPGSSGVNCFMYDWGNEYVYCCPPVKLVPDVIRHISTVPCMGVLVVPYWKTDKFWPLITLDGAHLSAIFTSFRRFKPTVRTGKWCTSYFSKNKRPEMLALYFDSSREMMESQISMERCLLDDCGKCKTRPDVRQDHVEDQVGGGKPLGDGGGQDLEVGSIVLARYPVDKALVRVEDMLADEEQVHAVGQDRGGEQDLREEQQGFSEQQGCDGGYREGQYQWGGFI